MTNVPEGSVQLNKVRCIGGSKDGEYLECKHGRMLNVPIMSELSICKYNEISASYETFKTEAYNLERIHGRNRDFFILVHESLTIDEALDRIINLF